MAASFTPFVILDAGCGTGKAIFDLRQHWLSRHPDLTVTLLGVESGKSRHQQAANRLGSGNVLWSAIEDAMVELPVSLLLFNPPCDRLRANRVGAVQLGQRLARSRARAAL